jgi:hypothetical protein
MQDVIIEVDVSRDGFEGFRGLGSSCHAENISRLWDVAEVF